MRLLSLRLLFGLCFSVVFSFVPFGYVYAVTYTWTVQESPYSKGASPNAACSAFLATKQNKYYIYGLTMTSEAGAQCKYGPNPADFFFNVYISRSGDSCQSGHTYNPANGVCVPDPALPTEDQCLAGGPGIFSKSGVVISSNGNNYVAVSGGGSVCYGQCTHSLSDRAASCYSSGEGTGFCNYVGTPTGEVCAQPDAPLGGTGDPLNPPDTPDVPPSDPNDPGCPSGYGWSGTTCAKNPDDNGNPPGDGSGGDGGDGGDTGGGDGGDTGGGGGGGGDTGGGDTGGGDTGGGDTGGGDTGGGDTGGGEIGGGTGGGTGSGGGTGEEGEEPVSSVGGEACSAVITCEGDAIQCAILRSQKKQACADEEARDYSKAAPTINAEISKGEYQLKEETVDASGFFNMGMRFYSSTCPAPKSLRIESFNRTIQLSYQPLCDFAGALSYIVVAMASLFFMVYVGRSFGGE
jgi:hypothetical protein